MIAEQHAYPVFEEDWGADEELLLIEGMKTYGVGNWQDLADHIGGRSKEEVEQHYKRIYLESETYPVPNLKRRFTIDPSEFAKRRRIRIEERRARTTKIPAPAQKPNASVPSCHEVQGYMPGRLEFEAEYENEAETTIKDMVFEPEDTEAEVELKLAILNIYNSRLTSRAERKRVMLEHKLLEYRRNVAIEKKRSKEERDVLSKVKAFARLLTPQDYQQFVANIMTELQCRRRIAELQEYRRNGLRTLAMASKYETDKAVRSSKMGHAVNSNNTISGARHSMTSSRYSLDPVTPLRESRVLLAGSLHPLNHSTVSTAQYLTHDTIAEEAPANDTTTNNNTNNANDTNTTNNNNLAITPSLNINAINTNTLTPKTATRLAELDKRIFRKPVANPLDISRSADVELLSPEEQVLCSQLRILPKPYLAIKETLFRELIRSGGVLKKRTARELIKIDVNKTARIYEFFQAQRWIA